MPADRVQTATNATAPWDKLRCLRLIPVSNRLSLALAISCGVHLLILWLAAHNRIEFKISATPTLPRNIHLSLSSLSPPQPKATTQLIAPTGADRGDKATAEATPSTAQAARPRAKTVLGDNLKPRESTATPDIRKPISATRIMVAAQEEARKIAKKEFTGVEKPATSIASRLDLALNPPREAPNVKTMADGTTRVVTKFGITYCNKPREDWRILGPEEDISVSVTCK